MNKKSIARLICKLVESRGWKSWTCKNIAECTCLTRGQITIGNMYLAKKGFIKKDDVRGKGYWTRTRKFGIWKLLLGVPETKLDMSTGKLVYV
jgi:hypothetical protein